MSEAREVHAWASPAKGQPLEPYTFTAPPLGPHGVEVAVECCGLCGSDVHLLNADGGYRGFPRRDRSRRCAVTRSSGA